MIRHRPFGSGHPYSIDTEQRWPIDPIAGQPVVLGVRSSADVTAVMCELSDGRSLPLAPVMRTSRGQTVDGGHLASAQARLGRAAGGWQLTLDELTPGQRLRYRFVSGGQTTRWFEFVVSEWRPSKDVPGSVPGTTTVLDGGGHVTRVRFALPLAAGEHVTGFGERYDALDHRGTSLDSVVFEQYKSQGAERKTYLPMPFAHVIGGAGWGFHVRTARRVWFDIGQSQSDLLWIEAEVDKPSDASDMIELAIYTGTPVTVLQSFLDEVGHPRELPAWVFRLWASANEWNTQAAVIEQMDLHRAYDIPVGSVVIEAWSDESTFTAWRGASYEPSASPHELADFTFPADGPWPDPKGMADELHARDIRLHLWQIPLIKMRPNPVGQARLDADEAIRQNVLVREEAPDGSLRPYRNRGWWFPLGLMPDLTDRNAARWWTDRRKYLVEEVGVDGFKTDGGEHAWGRDLRYLDGTGGDEGNARFPVAYAKAFGDLLEASGKAPVTFSRSGYTGSQAHGAFWAGDENSTWEAFRWSLFAGLSAASSGIVYWGWDFGGFSGEVPSAELYLRSAATATFVPIMQYHAEYNGHRKPSGQRTPWNIAERSGDDRVLPVFRKYAQLRERLVPYLAEAARSTIASGRPLMRPLYFDHPDDDAVWDHPLQWMLGDDLLVIPVINEGAIQWPVYLPAGDWVDAWTGESAPSGLMSRETPLDLIPVYVRASKWAALAAIFTSTA